MKLRRALPWIGVSLLVAAFTVAAFNVVRVKSRRADSDVKIHLRFAHWHLQSGLREAYDEVIAEYQRLNPHVTVEQLVIPQRVWPAWHRTQLVGGTAPDLIELGTDRGLNDELLARYYLPITDYVDQPNPYNAGTPLADVSWRSTFIDGLMGNDSYNPRLADFYGVPTALFTIRVYYNRELLRRIVGEDRPPRSYEELLELGRRIREWSRENDRPLIPIASSRVNGPLLISSLMRAQLQQFSREIAPRHSLVADRSLVAYSRVAAYSYLRDEWNFETPAVRASFELAREVAGFMQSGFSQLERDDATFAFTRGRALMIASGTFDMTSLRQEAPFEIAAFDLPLPTPDHPRYGSGVLGRGSEASKTLAGVFGITRQSKHTAQALDFLRFLTSREINRRFSQNSLWLPVIVDLAPPEEIAVFAAVIEGPLDGFDFSGLQLPMRGISALRFAYQSSQHLLYNHDGNVDAFLQDFEPRYRGSIREDFRITRRDTLMTVERSDPMLLAVHQLASTSSASDLARRRSLMLEAQNAQETSAAEIDWLLRAHAAPNGPLR